MTATDPGHLTATQTLRYRARPDIFRKIWSKNGFDGESYEYEASCERERDLPLPLETCYLWELTAVRVEAPDGRTFDLEKDFNIQSYSGDVTRRWVLYGPPGAGFPASGDYAFRYYNGDTLEYEESVPYTLKTVGIPTEVVARREGNDLVVEWTPPSDGERCPGGHIYCDGKVIVFPDDGGESISKLYYWGTRSVRLRDIPLSDGSAAMVHVTIGFFEPPSGGGFAYSEYVRMVW